MTIASELLEVRANKTKCRLDLGHRVLIGRVIAVDEEGDTVEIQDELALTVTVRLSAVLVVEDP